MNIKKLFQKEQPLEVNATNIPVTYKISKQQLFILFCMLAFVFLAYLPALHKGFINLDDIRQNIYITNFSFAKIPLIFSHYYKGQYAPVPFLLYGIINMTATAGSELFIYNLVSVVLHLITILLVFKLIWSLCSNFRIAFITAALFGIATMQVESIAWLAAVYKTCIYSIFFLSSLIVYISYLKTNKKKYFIVSILLFFVSCFCKEQAISLALAIVAIDIFFGRKLLSKKVIIEKIPFFLISVVFGLITIAAAKSFFQQEQEGISISSYSIIDSVIYAGYALCTYMYKLFVPLNLSFWYPYFPLNNSRLLYSIFPLLLLIIAGLYWYAIKKRNQYIIWGGLFFLLNILFSLASQVISVRSTVMADRYVYLASIGIFFIVAKGVDYLVEKKLVKLPVIAVIFVAFFLSTAYITYGRNQTWKNSLTLWNDVISKHQNIALAYYFRANTREERGDIEEAMDDYNKTIAIRPSYATAYYNRGILKSIKRDKAGALADYNKAISLRPRYSEAYINRGSIKSGMGDKRGAIEDYSRAIAILPAPEIFYNRGNLKKETGDKHGAIDDFNKAIALRPDFAEAYYCKGLIMFSTGDYQEAIINFNKVIEINPKHAEAYNNKGSSLNATGDYQEAINNFNKAIEINPAYLNAYDNRAITKYNMGDFAGAIDDCKKALQLNSNDQNVQDIIANAQQELQKLKN